MEATSIPFDQVGYIPSEFEKLTQGPTIYPVVVGHEIVGDAVRVGSSVTLVQKGQRVGVGAEALSCFTCPECKSDNEQYCSKQVETYNARYADGTPSYGGFANYVRVHEKFVPLLIPSDFVRFVFPIPDGIPSELAAPLFCAGVTVFSPLSRSGVGPSSSVGIIGLGGLGHYAIMLARAMGAKRVVVLSHSLRKREDALALGATDFIASSVAGEGWEKEYLRSLDVILCTASFQESMPLATYLSLLKVGGTFYSLGMPEGNLPAIPPVSLVYSNAALRGSNIGSRKEILEMLDLVDKRGVKSRVQLRKMKEGGQVLEEMEQGKGRYRWVLEADID